MASGLEQIKQKFSEMNERERNIVLILALVLVAFLWDQLLFSPMQRASQKTQQQINALSSQMLEQQKQATSMMEAAAQDPNRELKNKRDQLNAAIAQLDEKISNVTDNLIEPREMADVLERVLRQQTRLKLVKVINLAGEQIAEGEGEDNEGALYRHGVELTLEGEYFDTMRYLQALEKLPWDVVWSELEYEVIDYPRANIRLRINTLSTESGWIGV